MLVLAFAFTLPACGAFLVGARRPLITAARRSSSPIAEASPADTRAAREQAASSVEALMASRLAAAAEAPLPPEEVAALDDATKTLKPVWEGKSFDCPASIKNALGTGSQDFFGQLRNPSKDPAPETWDAVRTKWPALAGRSDDELLIALAPIKAVPVDRRML